MDSAPASATEESVIIHGITHSDILDAGLVEVYDQVLQQMASKIMVVHYQRIEREFFDQALKDRINEGIEFPVVDTMHLETLHQQRLHGGILNKVLGKKPDSVRLGLNAIWPSSLHATSCLNGCGGNR